MRRACSAVGWGSALRDSLYGAAALSNWLSRMLASPSASQTRATSSERALRPPLGRLERPLEERRRLDVRVLLLGAAAGLDRVAEGLGPALGAVVVEREQFGRLFGPLALMLLDDLGDPAMQLSPPPVRKPFVRGVADERVAEAERTGHVGIPFDELAESLPGLRCRRHVGVVLEHLDDQRSGEGHAEHRRPA